MIATYKCTEKPPHLRRFSITGISFSAAGEQGSGYKKSGTTHCGAVPLGGMLVRDQRSLTLDLLVDLVVLIVHAEVVVDTTESDEVLGVVRIELHSLLEVR